MKPRIPWKIGLGLVFATALQADTWMDEESLPSTPVQAAMEAKLDQLRPRLKGISVSANADGTCSASVDPEESVGLATLKGLPIRKLEVHGNMHLMESGKALDLGFLADAPLEELWIWKTPLKDIGPLGTTRLKNLLIMGSSITDVSPLKNLPLESLELWATDVSDISPLRGMHLKHLNIESSESARVVDLTPLDGMELESLKFHANGVTDGIGIVRRMKSLKQINGVSPADFWKEYDADAPLREMMAGKRIKFTKLYGGGDGTMSLWIHGDERDLSQLAGLPVAWLGIRDSKISDLRPLIGLPLCTLVLSNSVLTDLSPLSQMPLTELHLSGNQLADLGPLRETKLETLWISCPKVVDLSPLRKLPLRYLDFNGCGVTDITPLDGMRLEIIEFDAERIKKGLDVLRGMKALKEINHQDVEAFFKPADEGGGDVDPFSNHR